MSDVHSDAASRLRTVLSSVASSSGSVREQLASHRAARAIGVAAGLAAGGLFYSTVIERNAFTLRHATMSVLEPGAAPLRVLHISDLHMMPNQRLKQAWVSELESLEPDLVVNTGDNLAHPGAVPAVIQSLGGLLSRPGLFVFGSNDYFGPSPRTRSSTSTPTTNAATAHRCPGRICGQPSSSAAGSMRHTPYANSRSPG